jgi:glycosyltransferase 2 family protein
MTVPRRGLPWRRVAFWSAQTVIVVALCWAVFSNTDLARVGEALRQANVGLMGLAVLVLVFERIARPYRLAKLLGGNTAFTNIIAVQNVAQLINLALALRSGEMFLVVALRGLGSASGSFALSIVAIDRLLDIVCVLLVFGLSIVSVVALPGYVGDTAVIMTAASVGVICTILVLVLTRTTTLAVVRTVLARIVSPARAVVWLSRFEQLVDGFAVLLDARRLMPAIAATLVTWGCAIAAAWLVLTSIWPHATVLTAALAICLGTIGVTLVSVPAGIGILHAAFALAALASGASQEVALAFAILEHFFVTAVTIVMGIIGLPIVKRAGMKSWATLPGHAR